MLQATAPFDTISKMAREVAQFGEQFRQLDAETELIIDDPHRVSDCGTGFRVAEASALPSTLRPCRVKSAGPQRATTRHSRPSNNSTMMMITTKPNAPLGP